MPVRSAKGGRRPDGSWLADEEELVWTSPIRFERPGKAAGSGGGGGGGGGKLRQRKGAKSKQNLAKARRDGL